MNHTLAAPDAAPTERSHHSLTYEHLNKLIERALLNSGYYSVASVPTTPGPAAPLGGPHMAPGWR